LSQIADQIKNAFAFLLLRGYALVAESDVGPLAGAITYRSTELWIAVEWDHGSAHVEFAATGSWAGRVPWDNVDHLLRGVTRYEHEPPLFQSAPIPVLATFVRERLEEIERRFSPAERSATEAFLNILEADRRRRAQEYWRRLERRPG